MVLASMREAGAVHGIPLPGGLVAGVRRLSTVVCAVHAPIEVNLGEASMDEVLSSGVLFEVMVADSAFARRSTWKFLGVRPLDAAEQVRTFTFVHTDVVTGTLREFDAGAGHEANAQGKLLSEPEALRLEDAAVWSAVHVERRLLARLESREEGFLSTMLRPWQAQERRRRVAAGIESPRPLGGLVLDRAPDWG